MKTLTRQFMLTVLFSLIAFGNCFAIDESIIQFRSFEDPDVPPNPLICTNAPFYDENFPAYVLLGASLWSLQTNAASGTVVNEKIRRIGTGDACVKITDLSPGAEAPFYMEFEVGDFFIHATASAQSVPTISRLMD